MSVSERRAHIIQTINSIQDEETLSILEEAIGFYAPETQTDITDGLTATQLEELQAILDEPSEKNTVTKSEFDKLFAKWRTK